MYHNNVIMPLRGNFISPLRLIEPGDKKNGKRKTVKHSPDSECIVNRTHALFLKVSRFFGMAPLRFKPRGKDYAVFISNFMIGYGYLLVTAVAAATLLGKSTRGIKKYPYLSSHIYQFVSWCDSVMAVVMAIVGVYGASGRFTDFVKFMDTIDSVDKNIGIQHSHTVTRKVWASVIFFLFFFTLVVVDDIIYICINAGTEDLGMIVQNIGYHFLGYVVTILTTQFALTVMAIGARIRAINEALTITARHMDLLNVQNDSAETLNVFTSTNKTYAGRNTKKVSAIVRKSVNGKLRLAVSPSEGVHRIATLYGEIRDEVHRTNKSYGISLIILIICNVSHLVVLPYFAILNIHVRVDKLHYLIQKCVLVFFKILNIFMVIEPCHYAVAECRKTEGLMCRMLLMSPTSGPLSARIELFLRQLTIQTLSFNPMGLCTLDRTLLVSVLGAATTYLVILIQFQRSDG